MTWKSEGTLSSAGAALLACDTWIERRKLRVLAYLRYGKVWAVDFATGKEDLLTGC